MTVELNIKYLLLFTSISSASSAHLLFPQVMSPTGRVGGTAQQATLAVVVDGGDMTNDHQFEEKSAVPKAELE